MGPAGSLLGPGGSLLGHGGSWWALVGPWWVLLGTGGVPSLRTCDPNNPNMYKETQDLRLKKKKMNNKKYKTRERSLSQRMLYNQ